MNSFLFVFLLSLTVFSFSSVYADEHESLGASETFDDLFNQGETFTNEQLGDCKIDEISATNEECLSLAKAGFDALQKSKDLAFSFHHIAEAFIQFLSPMELDGAILAIVSAVLGMLFLMKIFGKFGKHAIEIVLVLAGIALLFLVLGDSLEI
jgi:hypothetical protein